ncbi:MAG: hypothetical protein JSV03_12295 [Planctomycetota bacterium]|nr:MAG: hypothetical protein JSV03_12295 [Planctomycetota bacterium]
MRTKLKFLYWTIEINLILWLVMIGSVFADQDLKLIKPVAIIGFVLSALLQHWAYYHLRKTDRVDGRVVT